MRERLRFSVNRARAKRGEGAKKEQVFGKQKLAL
jgi:hypothetical protein